LQLHAYKFFAVMLNIKSSAGRLYR